MSSSMYEMLKKSLSDQRTGESFKDILKTEIGKSYTVRLIPNMENIGKSTNKYFNHTWKSLATGNTVSCVCPTTHGERCSICEERVRLYRTEDEKDKANAKLLGKKEQWLVNVYVIDDQTNPKNNGTVKILRYGKQIDDILKENIEGDYATEVGIQRIFNLTEEGCNLKIKVVKNQGGYAEYKSSRFTNSSEIPGMTDAKAEQIYKNIFNLENIFDKKTPEEVDIMLDTHYRCNISATASRSSQKEEEPSVSESKSASTPTPSSDTKEVDAASDKRVKDLLADLD